MNDHYQEYRCPNDDKLLFKGILIDSDVEIKCKGCRKIVQITGVPASSALCKQLDCAKRIQ